MFAVILAGGRGTRFWPRSRAARPKQVIPIVGERSMIQATLDRVTPLVPAEKTFVLTNQTLKPLVEAQLPQIPRDQIIAEPVGRNTAPAIGLAAALIRKQFGNGVMAVLPSDHHIREPEQLLAALRVADEVARAGENIIVIGLRPTRPETGYGYIEVTPQRQTRGGVSVFEVARFVEKPDRARAEAYLRAGHFFWNGGMFVWTAETVLRNLERFLPHSYALIQQISESVAGKPDSFDAVLEACFPQMDNISIDYAVLEKARNIYCIPCDMGWSDVGSWEALAELVACDADGNQGQSERLVIDAQNNFVESAKKTVALIGVENLIVIETEDALLICRRDRAQDVSRIVKELEKRKREDLL